MCWGTVKKVGHLQIVWVFKLLNTFFIHSAEYHSQYFQIYLKEKLLQRCEGSFSFVVRIVFEIVRMCVSLMLTEETKKEPQVV